MTTPIEIRPYQGRAVEFLLPRKRGFVIAPAGSGKTWIAAAAAARKAEPFSKVMWLANTKEQCEQARAAIALMQWREGVEIPVHCFAARQDVSDADILIIDECHHLPAPVLWATVMFFKGIVWGFSATPWNRADPDRDTEIKLFFGEANFITIPRDEVQAGGSITAGVVQVHHVDEPGCFDKEIESLAALEMLRRVKKYPQVPADEHYKRCMWEFTRKAVIANSQRNQKIQALAKESDASTLVLVASIEHGQQLAGAIPGAVVVFSKMGKKKREAAIAGFRDGSIRVMVATSLADEGLDVPRAAVLILACGGRSEGKLEQRAGRVMRPHHTKTFGQVHDFSDRGARMAYGQFMSRRRTYKQLGYEIR